MQFNNLTSPKAIAIALYNISLSKVRDLYARDHATLLRTTPPVNTIAFDLTKTQQYSGRFPLAAVKLFSALFVQSKKRCNKIICTYVLTNTKTGMVYVGSTQDFYARWMKHYNLLKLGGHTNIRLQEHSPSQKLRRVFVVAT